MNCAPLITLGLPCTRPFAHLITFLVFQRAFCAPWNAVCLLQKLPCTLHRELGLCIHCYVYSVTLGLARHVCPRVRFAECACGYYVALPLCALPLQRILCTLRTVPWVRCLSIVDLSSHLVYTAEEMFFVSDTANFNSACALRHQDARCTRRFDPGKWVPGRPTYGIRRMFAG